GDVNRTTPAEVSRRRLPTVPLGHLAIHIHIFLAGGGGAEVLKIFEAVIGARRPLHCLGTAIGWDPDRRMRLLIGPRPKIDPRNMVMLALEGERLVFGPGADNQFLRLVEALVLLRRIDAPDQVFDTDPAHKTADEPPAHDVVEHGKLFG